jgi:DNA-binding MarR family transcriptional regulator
VASAKWLNDNEMKAWRGFVTTAAELHRAIESDLAQFGIDGGDYQLLAMLSEAPEHRMQLCELAEILRLSRSGLTRRMEGVVKAKFVERVSAETDRRTAYAHLTDKGYTFLKRIAPAHVKSVRNRLIDHLSENEIKAFGTAFSKIRKSLSNPD